MKDWKTTLFGVIGAVAVGITGSHDWKHILQAAAIAAIGYFAKDK